MELWRWTLAPGERYDALPDGPGFSEMIWILSGELTLETEAPRPIRGQLHGIQRHPWVCLCQPGRGAAALRAQRDQLTSSLLHL